MNQILENSEFFIKVDGPGQEKKVVQELIKKINEKLTDNKIPEDGKIDDSNMLERIIINETHHIRVWYVGQVEGGLSFDVSLFV